MKRYAKLAKNPGSAKSTDLELGIAEIEAEKTKLQQQKVQLQKNFKDAIIAQALGDEADPKAIKDDISSIDDILEGLNSIEASLRDALEKAKTREAKARLAEIEKEIERLRETQEAHYKKGLTLLAQALSYLGSAWGFPGSDPVMAGERIKNNSLTTGSTFKQTYLKVYEEVEKPKVHAASRINELNQEKADLEKSLRVGSFAVSAPKEPDESEPPKVHMFGLDPGL